MSKELQGGSQSDTKQPASLKISARKVKKVPERISQGDIFEDIEVVENIIVENSEVIVKKLSFPYVVCLNQECDLESDYRKSASPLCDSNLLHLAIAPAFNFDQFISGNHWGAIFSQNPPQKRKDTNVKKIIDNELPRFHYLKFPDADMPELVIDFKHFFTIHRDVMYSNLENRLCSIDDLFKEKINQRFSYYISRIGLPEHSI